MSSLVHQMNMASLLTAMQELKLDTIIANYSGSGDSGCVDDVEYIDKNNEKNNLDQTEICLIFSSELMDIVNTFLKNSRFISKNNISEVLKEISLEHFTAVRSAIQCFSNLPNLLALDSGEKIQTTLRDLVEDVVYRQLYDQVPGWENNDGADGQIIISLSQSEDGHPSLEIDTEHKSYFTDYELSSHSSEFSF